MYLHYLHTWYTSLFSAKLKLECKPFWPSSEEHRYWCYFYQDMKNTNIKIKNNKCICKVKYINVLEKSRKNLQCEILNYDIKEIVSFLPIINGPQLLYTSHTMWIYYIMRIIQTGCTGKNVFFLILPPCHYWAGSQ